MNRLKPPAERIIVEEQAGFRAGRSTTKRIFNLRILCEKYLQHRQDLRVWHAALWELCHQTPLWQGRQCIPLQRQHRRLVLNNNWSPTGMSTLTHSLQHISGKDHDRRLRRSQRHWQNWRQNNHQSLLSWWHLWLAGEEEERCLVERLHKASTAYDVEITAEKTKFKTNNTSGINKVSWCFKPSHQSKRSK